MHRYVNRGAAVGVTLVFLIAVAGVAGAARAKGSTQAARRRSPAGVGLPANGVARAATEALAVAPTEYPTLERDGAAGGLGQAAAFHGPRGARTVAEAVQGRGRGRSSSSCSWMAPSAGASWTCRASRTATASGPWCTQCSGP